MPSPDFIVVHAGAASNPISTTIPIRRIDAVLPADPAVFQAPSIIDVDEFTHDDVRYFKRTGGNAWGRRWSKSDPGDKNCKHEINDDEVRAAFAAWLADNEPQLRAVHADRHAHKTIIHLAGASSPFMVLESKEQIDALLGAVGCGVAKKKEP